MWDPEHLHYTDVRSDYLPRLVTARDEGRVRPVQEQKGKEAKKGRKAQIEKARDQVPRIDKSEGKKRGR